MITSQRLLPSLFFLSAVAARCQSVTIPAGTPLPVSLPQHVKMKTSETLQTELLYPVYEDNRLVLPAKTVILGEVTGLNKDGHRRIKARLRGDFTPYNQPVVRFTAILPPGGALIPIQTGEASDGAPIYKVVPTVKAKGGIVGEYFKFGVQHVKDTFGVFTAPQKGDRLLQFVYQQLPYHPQRIQRATSWTVETSAPITLDPVDAPVVIAKSDSGKKRLKEQQALPIQPAANADGPPTWVLQAYLDERISSETSTADEKIHATVAEPVLNLDGSVAVPQGSILTGTVAKAKAARHFARAGLLRFSFDQLTLPGQEAQRVRTRLKGADSSSDADLAMDSEGQVKAKPQDKVAVPLLLVLMASRPLDRDRGHDIAGKDAVGSSSLGLLSLIVGTAAGVPNFASGLGFYSAALSIYPRWFAKGTSIAFPKNTRIVLQTTGTRSSTLKRDAGSGQQP